MFLDQDHHGLGPVQLDLFDAQGRVVRSTTVANPHNGVYIGDMPPGCYIVRIQAGPHRVPAIKWVRM